MAAQAHEFGDFRLLGPQGPLLRGGSQVKLQPKATAVLWTLLQRAGEVVTKAELLDAVWPNQDVGEEALSFQIKRLRAALGDDARAAQYLTTVHRIGFRLAVGRDRVQGHAEERGALFVGRETELSQLRQAARAARGPRQQMLFVTGEPGIGKTALIEHFLGEQKPPVMVGRGRCHEHRQGREPYSVLVDALDTLLRQPAGAACVEALKDCAPNWLLQLPGLLTHRKLAKLKAFSANVAADRMQREWQAAMTALCTEHPLVLALEDLHWSDKSALDLLSVMLQDSPELPLLVVASYRPVDAILARHPVNALKQSLTGAAQAAELPLTLFTAEEVDAYLSARLRGQTLPSAISAQLYRRTDGHPLFLVQLAAALEDPAAPLGDHSGDVLEAVPDSLKELIGAQIDRLAPAAQRLLEQASVIGDEFSAALLAAGTQQSLQAVESGCLALAKSGRFIDNAGMSVWPDGTTAGCFRFRHDLYRQVLLLRLPDIEHARACERIATRLEQGYSQRCHLVAARLADYYAGAGQPGKSFAFHIQAAYQALATGAAQEAGAQADLAGEYVETLGQPAGRRRAEFALALIRVHIGITQSGFGAPALELQLARLRLLQPQVADTALRESALGLLWMTSFFNSKHDEAMAYAGQAAELGWQIHAPALQCAGLAWRSLGAHVTGVDDQAYELSEQAIALALSHDWDASTLAHAEPGCVAISASAQSLWVRGQPDAALARAFEGVARAEMMNNPYLRCSTIGTTLGALYLLRREAQKLLDNCDRIRPLCERYAHTETLAWITKFKGLALCLLGQPQAGLPLLRAVVEQQRQAGALVSLLADTIHLGEHTLAAGDTDAAAKVLAEGFDILKQTGERQWEPELWRVQGDWHRLAGDDAAQAERCYRRALKLAEARSALSYALRAAVALAQLKQAANKPAAGARLLQAVYARFDEGFDTPDLIQARQLLNKLA